MPNYLLEDCAQSRAFLAGIGRTPTDLSPFLLVWLTEEEISMAKSIGLKVWDDLSGQEI